MIRGYAPHIWENNLESDKRRDTALLLAAELDDRKVAVVRRLRCALSRLLLESEQVRAVPNPQPSAKRDMAAPSKYGLCRIRSPRQSGAWQRRASTGCAFGADRKRAACGSFSLCGSPPHTRRMRCSRAKAKRAIRESPLRDSGNPLHTSQGAVCLPPRFRLPSLSLQYLVKLSYFASVS